MKKNLIKISLLAFSFVVCLCALFATSIGAADTTEEKTPVIASQNIMYSDKFSLMYAVDADTVTSGEDVTLEVYEDKALTKRVYIKTVENGQTNNTEYNYPKSAYIFITSGIPYHMMASEYYVKVSVGNNESELKRYSVAEYFYQRLASTGDKKPNEVQEDFYKNAIKFGADAEVFTGKKTADADDLVSNLRYVTVDGGTVDGFTAGVYPMGTELVPLSDDPSVFQWTVDTYDITGKTNKVFGQSSYKVADAVKTEIKAGLAYDENYRPGADGFETYSEFPTFLSTSGITRTIGTDTAKGNIASMKLDNANSYAVIYQNVEKVNADTATAFEVAFDIRIDAANTSANEYFEFQFKTQSATVHRTSIYVTANESGSFTLSNSESGTNYGSKTFSVDSSEWFHLRMVMFDGDEKCYIYINDSDDPMINTTRYSSNYSGYAEKDISALSYVQIVSNSRSAGATVHLDNIFCGFTEDRYPEKNDEYYKSLLASFDTADFGDYTAKDPANQFNQFNASTNNYGEPLVYPVSDSHPRVLFTGDDLSNIKSQLGHAQNASAHENYMRLSEAACNGKFRAVAGNQDLSNSSNTTNNYDSYIVSVIEAKAFRYAMTGEKSYGYEALYAIKNAILTIRVGHGVGDWCRLYGYLMYVAGCVYDWCYDLMSPEDMTQIISGSVDLLGKHLEIVCYGGPGGDQVPTKQGTMYGHGAEDQLLVDYLSFAIACYDEAPEIYELVAGRILNEYVPAQNFLYESGSHWEGSMYGFVRSAATLVSNVLFNKMTGGTVTPFENIETVVETGTHYIRPDGQLFRIGDVNENLTSFQFQWLANCCFYAGNLYGNEYLKSYAYKYLNNFTSFTNSVAGLSAVQFLATNNTDLSHIYEGTAPLTRKTTYPLTNLFAKSGNESDDFAVYMTMPETYALSHAHMECGSFQIYYKGALATDSGAYTTGLHSKGYNMQTISSNSLLIYNPSKFNPDLTNGGNYLVYSGGQSLVDTLPTTLEELKASQKFNQCTSLGTVNKEDNGKYLYSYMGGDMTKAYDSDTVDEVTRYMLAVATGDPSCPLVFLTFDRITSDSADYRKSALIHVQNAPEISGDFAIITNGEGKMVVQSVGDATTFTTVEGFKIPAGENLTHGKELIEGSIAEYGWGRIEISPETKAETNHMLTVMYVTDSTNEATEKAEDISSENLAGTMIFGKAMLFSKNEKLLTEESSFTINSGADCFVAGVDAGTWTVTCGGNVIQTVTVAAGENLLTFTADAAGTYTIARSN